ncbi:MAG: hypothetical protein II877_08290, partial [Synergistaceae bacterium]|nr:hypothetical protein [Synergistaceae bacterium]
RPSIYTARLKVEAEGRSDLLSDIMRVIEHEGSSLTNCKAPKSLVGLVRIKYEITVRDLAHLYSVMSRINEVRGILSVERE